MGGEKGGKKGPEKTPADKNKKMVFYGGNEVSSLVFDIGANSSKVGYAGADSPSFVFSSVGAWNGSKHVLGNLASQHGLQADWTRQPVKHGLVNDWDALEAVWDHAYSTCLRTSSELHPLMLTQSAWADSAQQEKVFIFLYFSSFFHSIMFHFFHLLFYTFILLEYPFTTYIVG